MPAKANPPPVPQPPPIRYESQVSLIELPHFYLLERGQWSDFRRALNNCGLTWNIPDWMCTIVYKGQDYLDLLAKDSELDDIFKLPTITVGEEKVLGSGKSKSLIKLLGFPNSMNEYIQVSTKYCNLSKLEFEPDTKLPARQKLWSWIVKCLQGPKITPGPYYYLINQVKVYDISHLFKRLIEVIETVTICSLDDEVYNVTHLDFDPSLYDIFGYLEELRRAVRKLSDLNERLPEEGRVILSEAYIRSRLVRAARQIPTYKSIIDHLVIQPVEVWSKMSLEELCSKFESAQANDLSLVPKRNQNQSHHPVSDEQVNANFTKSKIKREQKQTKNCHEFERTGTCKRGSSCHFLHQHVEKQKPEQRSLEKQSVSSNSSIPSSSSQPAPQHPPKHSCRNCGEKHKRGECKKPSDLVCTWCTKRGHIEEKCHSRLNGKPKILFSSVENDGVIVLANLFVCEDNLQIESQLGKIKPTTLPEVCVESVEQKIISNVFFVEEKNTCVQNISVSDEKVEGGPPPPQGMVIEKFYADTGANRSVHPSIKAADKYFAYPMDISTASGSKNLKSEGVGSMKLFSPSGEPISGFDRVIFCKNVTEKLCSVGELADAGYISVFDEKKLVTYLKKDFKVSGKSVTTDLRDTKTKLYPITFYRETEGVKREKGGSIPSQSVAHSLSLPPPPSLPLQKQISLCRKIYHQSFLMNRSVLHYWPRPTNTLICLR